VEDDELLLIFFQLAIFLPLNLTSLQGITHLSFFVLFFLQGLLTTPQLHYLVRCMNSRGAYGQPTEVGYYSKLAAAFQQLNANVSQLENSA